MNTRTVFAVGLGCLGLLAGAGTVWHNTGTGQPAAAPTSSSGQGAGWLQRGTSLDSGVSSAEKEALERRSGEAKSELNSLRTGLTQVSRVQTASSQEVMKPGGASPAAGDTAPTPLTPEQLGGKTDARMQAQLETLDAAMRAEQADPGAQASLQQGFQHAALEGLQLTNAQCGATLCRMELTGDGAGLSNQTLGGLSRIAPWAGQGFAHIDSQSGNIMVYVATAGHTLPH